MNYHEALYATVSASEARAEIERRAGSIDAGRFDWYAFASEFGSHAEYEGSDILDFLGY